jgi:hypothetical protein
MNAAEQGHVVDIGWPVVSVVFGNVVGLAPDGFMVHPGNAQCLSRATSARHWAGVADLTVRDIQSGS